jgi:hypothetical protein
MMREKKEKASGQVALGPEWEEASWAEKKERERKGRD